MYNKKHKFKKTTAYITIISTAFLFNFALSSNIVYANDKSALTADSSEKSTLTEMTEMIGIKYYKYPKNEKLENNFKNMLAEIIYSAKTVLDRPEDIIFEKLSDKVYNDTANHDSKVYETVYLLNNYIVKIQNFNPNIIGKQKVTIKYKLLSIIDMNLIQVTKRYDEAIFDVQNDTSMKVLSKSIIIDLMDVTAPVIKLNKNAVTIKKGDDFSIHDYVGSVTDDIDKKIEYTVDGTYNVNKVGKYKLKITAKDKSGNIGMANFTLTVEQANSSIISTAFDYKSYPYVWGGTTPTGFDCSGFVQYVFAQNGISLPRVAADQGASGYSVSADDIQPGDIVIYGNGAHVALYAGNGQVIHALNPSVGVTVGQWNIPYNGPVTTIRRVI